MYTVKVHNVWSLIKHHLEVYFTRSVLWVYFQEVYLEDTSKYYSKLIYFMHVKNIHWLVYQKIEELSFNSGVKHEKLVSPTERILVHNLLHFIKPTTCFAKYTYK